MHRLPGPRQVPREQPDARPRAFCGAPFGARRTALAARWGWGGVHRSPTCTVCLGVPPREQMRSRGLTRPLVPSRTWGPGTRPGKGSGSHPKFRPWAAARSGGGRKGTSDATATAPAVGTERGAGGRQPRPRGAHAAPSLRLQRHPDTRCGTGPGLLRGCENFRRFAQCPSPSPCPWARRSRF